MKYLSDISVIVPMYNKQNYITSSLQSICENITLPREVVIVDDCSTDQSWQIASNFVKTYRGPIDFILLKNSQNNGPLATRLYAITQARCSYIAFLDADDFWHPQFVQSVTIALNSSAMDILTVAFHSIRLNKKIFDARDFSQYCNQLTPEIWQVRQLEAVLCKNFILGGGNVIARRELFDGLRLENSDRNFEDWYAWLTLFAKSPQPLKIFFLDQALYIYNDIVVNSLSNRKIAYTSLITEPLVLHTTREIGFSRLECVIYWCWITSSTRRIPSIVNRLRYFLSTGAGIRYFCSSRYMVSGLLSVAFGNSATKLSNSIRRQKY